MVRRPLNFDIDRRHVALWLGSSIEAPEHPVQEVRLKGALRPIHPAIGVRSHQRIRTPKLLVTITCREIAQDCVGLPNSNAVVLDNWYASVRVPCTKFRGIEARKRATEFDVPMV